MKTNEGNLLIVTGANGKLGRLVVEALLKRVPAERVAVSVRDPDQARALAARGVRVRRGDYAEPASLAHAFEGASRVLVVSSNTVGEEAVRHHRAAIDAVKAVGAQRIFYTSHVGASPTSAFDPTRDHATTELALRDSGVPFTSLRNGFYADSAVLMLGGALTTGELVAPEDGAVSWTAHADLAEATAILMSEAGPSESTSVNLTASEAIDLETVAALAAEIAGRPIRRVVVPDEAYRSAMIARGLPAPRAAMMVGLFAASKKGEFARIDPTLERLLGRPPTAFRKVLEAAITKQLT